MNDDSGKAGTEAVSSGKSQRRPWDAPRVALIVGCVLAVLAGGVTAWYGWSWWSASQDNALGYARAREDVLRVGSQGIANFNTLDPKNVKAGIDRWQQSSTGTLLDEITRDRATYEQQIAAANTMSTATIVDAAVTELDTRAGKAMVIAFVNRTVTPAGQQAVDKRERFQGELTRTSSGWKLSNIVQVAVTQAGS
jgi:Mce-associated membrane protein